MGARIFIPNPKFKPRWYQRPFVDFFTARGHDGSERTGVAVHHRRAGKDLMGMNTLITCSARRRGAYWHTFPTFEQGRKAIWEGFTSDGDRVVDLVFPPEYVRRRDNQQMMIELKWGSIYRLIGLDKIEAVGAGPVGVLHSEYSIAKPKGADLISPMLRQNRGWEAYVYTPRGSNHGKTLFDRIGAQAKRDPGHFFCDLKTLFDTRAYDPEKTIADERARGRPEALIRQEYLCDWTAANVGAVWGDLIETLEKLGAVSEFDDFDGDRVFTTWDLGGAGAQGDATCFWLWAARDDGADLLGYYENHGKTLGHYFDELATMERQIGARAFKHWLPHDARSRGGGGLVTGVSVLEQCVSHWGMERVAIYPEDSLLNGIQAARWLLQRKVRFHERCREGVEALKAYHYAWDDDRKTFANRPEHDWSSHPADAFRGVALVVRFSEERTRKPKQAKKRPQNDSATLDEAWASYDREHSS